MAAVEDLTISGEDAREAVTPAIRAIIRHGFAVSRGKVRVMSHNEPQKVTGVVINDSPSAGTKYIRATEEAVLDYLRAATDDQKALERIAGKISFIKYLCPQQGEKVLQKCRRWGVAI